ncbi:hypothetical protein [Salinicola halimionae]|uniref:hypothetical protein n=1 Tax=Salinicola halimionae TaxID=1949081 RepID=UPI001300B96A|nr:hypothetical protein [Salinicola halimionae]
MAAKNPSHDFLKGSDMVVATRGHWPLARRLDQLIGNTLFADRSFEIDQILKDRAAIRMQDHYDMLDEYRLGAHVADDAACLQRAAEAPIDDDLRLPLPLEIEIQQLCVEKPNQQRA